MALLVGLVLDALLRQRLLGLNFVLFTALWVGVCIGATLVAKKPLRNHTILYAAIALANAILVFFRASPLVQFWSVVITLVALFLLVGTSVFDNFNAMPLLNRWRETITVYLRNALNTPRAYFDAIRQKKSKRSINISRGAFIAVGLAFVFIVLFVSADAVIGNLFSGLGDALASFFRFFERFDVGRIVSIAFWTFAASSIALFIYRSLSGNAKPSLTLHTQLTHKDSLLIFITLLAIFAAFVAVQLYFLFSGGKLPEGLTYAEYARQGYGQLLVATLLASAAIKGVVTATHEGHTAKNLRSAAAALVVLNGIIVVSAWKRLSLYESAYGWTEARFVAHLGLICVALGCAALLLWLYGKITAKQLYAGSWYIVLIVLMVAAIANPDAVIARKNIVQRSDRVGMLDTTYLRNLSRDSWPSICAEAPRLVDTKPLEYDALAEPRLNAQNDISRGFSRHYTHDKSYVDDFSSCL